MATVVLTPAQYKKLVADAKQRSKFNVDNSPEGKEARTYAGVRYHSLAEKHYIPPQTEDVRDAKRWRVGDSL